MQKKLMIKVEGKQAFKVSATRYTDALQIEGLAGLLNLFRKYSKFTVTDGIRSVTIPLRGSARAIQSLKSDNCLK